jgi:filamentous hemagglutinin family protein
MHPLNKIFRTIWSDALGAWIAVSELVKTKGKRSTSSLLRVLSIGGVDAASDDIHRHRFKPATLFALCFLSLGAHANPMGGNVVSGNASFNSSGNTLTVTNTPGTIIHWQDFSIQQNEITRFNQQSASSAVLNRVVGGNTSQILGSLQSNGRVFLVNPNGVVFGAGATVDVAGLVATSLNLSDADFLAGRHRFTSDPNAQTVSNAGNINAQQGGEIWLIAPNVENSGVITAPDGEILLAAGSSVELVNSLDPNLRVNITAPAGDATNVGQLVASAGRLGLFGTIVKNSGQVSADSATLQGGKIVFRSSQRTEISGTASAQGVGGGEIKVLSDMQQGTVQVSGTLDASAPQSGDGGFIDTSAAHLDIAPAANIKANATNGQSGEWLIDPLDVTIGVSPSDVFGTFVGGVWMPTGTGSFITTGTIQTALNAGTSVTITTVNGGFAEAGDINVNWSIAKTAGAAATLTLNAENNINFAANSGISSTVAVLDVVLRSDADADGAGSVTFAGTNTFSLAGGRVDLYYNPVSYTDAATKSDSLGNPYSGVFTATPYTAWMLVNNVTNLQDMNTNLAGNYVLGTAIDATATSGWNTGAGFIPVGDATTHFTGNFDGMGNTIDGLTINRPTTDYVGMFGYVGTGSYISNVILTNASVTGQNYVGSLVGTLDFSTIDNATVGGTVSGLNYVGGLLGDSIYLGTVSNSSSSVNVTSTGLNHVGGLVGRSQIYSTISASTASGSVTANSAERVGGLVGYSGFNSVIDTSTSSSIVSGSWSVGGLVGRNAGSITNSSATGAVSATTVSGYTSTVGGLVGYNVWGGYNLSGVTECSFSCSSYSYGNISGSFASGNVTGISSVGGLVGDNNSGASIGGTSYASGTVTGNYYVGGLAGYNIGSISNAYATGSVVGSGAANNNIGGLAGYNGGNITVTYASGVTVSGGFYVGGLVGFNQGNLNASFVSSGNVTGNTTVGGLVGYNNGSVTSSYVDGGSVSATRQIGGLTGTSPGTLTNSHYNIDTVLLNGGPMVTRGGIYNTQYASWVAGAYVPLAIANYSGAGQSLELVGGVYTIATAQGMRDMLAFADDPAYSFLLTANIDLSGTPGLYIPYLAATSFDGGGFTVSNLNVSAPNKGMGLFGITASGTTVTNLGVQDATVNGAAGVGAIIGDNQGALINSHATRLVTGLISGSSSVGGLVGNNGFGASITNSYVSSGAVTATVRNIGGLLGNEIGTTTNSHYNIDAVTTNGGNNVTMTGLYATQYNDWFNGGTLTPLVITNYASLVLQVDGSYGINSQQGMKDMLGFADDPAGYDFSLTGSIDLTGMSGYYVPKLSGSFNGNSFTISNLSLNLPNYEMGLFGKTASNSVVHNLGLVNASVTGYADIGALVGINFGNIDTVSVTGSSTVTATNAIAGGLVGQNNGSSTSLGAVSGFIGNSYIDGGTVSAANGWVGGLVGNNSRGYIDASHASNTTVTGTSIVGGLVGNNQGSSSLYGGQPSGTIGNSYVSNGLVISTGGAFDGSIGGLVGRNIDGNIDLAYVLNATVNGGAANSVGGLVGLNQGGVNYIYQGPSTSSALAYTGFISNSYVSGGSVSSIANDVGGLVGHNFSGAIDQSYVDTVGVSGMSNIGGLVGYDGGEGWGGGLGLISNSHALNTLVSGASNVGGLVGIVAAQTSYNSGDNFDAVINSYVSGGTINGGVIPGSATGLVGPLSGIGGLIGYNDRGNVAGSYVAGGTVVAGGTASGVGGLVGIHVGSSTFGSSTMIIHGIVSGSFVDGGTVSGSSDVGGLVGSHSGTVEFSYVAGASVSASGTAGGLIGSNDGSILQSYAATGSVSGAATGGLVGVNSIFGSVNDSYWNTTSSGQATAIGSDLGGGAYVLNVAGLTATQMQTMSSFAGWDIANTGGAGTIWRIYEGHTAPLLASFLTQTTVTANDAVKTYDGIAYSGGNGYTTSVAGAILSGTFGGSSQGATNAGSYAISASGLYSDQFGYDITAYVDGVLTIDPKVVALNGSKVYDGTAVFTGGTDLFVATGVGAETLLLSGTANTLDKNVGNTDLLDFGTLALADDTGLASNYTLTGAGLTGTVSITPFALTVSATGVDRVYDATAVGTVTLADNRFAGDVLTLGYGSAAFLDKNVGTAKQLDVSGIGVTGTDAGNYSFNTTAATTANITPFALSGTISNGSSVYGAVLNPGVLTFGNTFAGDVVIAGTVTVNTAGLTSSSGNLTAGTHTGIQSVSGVTGADAGNYTFAGVTGDYIVTPRALTVSAAAANRVYNGTTNATVALSDDRIAGDLMNTSFGSTAFADKNAGVGKTVTVSGISVAGPDSGNYTFNTNATAIADITPAVLTVLAVSDSKVLGTSDPVLRYIATGYFDPVSTILSGDPVRDAGEVVGNYAIGSGTLLTNSNYTLDFVPGIFTIRAPSVIQQITQNTVDAGGGGSSDPLSDEEDDKKKDEQLVQNESAAQQETNKLIDQLPVCR